MNQRPAQTLEKLRAVLNDHKAAIEALAREATALGLPADAPPTLEQIKAAAPPEVLAALQGAVREAESVLAELGSPARPKTKIPRKKRETI